MGQGQFSIRGIPIKNPSMVAVEDYDITTLTRLASAKMVGDLVSPNRKILFEYEVITGYELDKIYNAVRMGGMGRSLFFPLYYEYNNRWLTNICYTGALTKNLFRKYTQRPLGWVWENFAFDFIEQWGALHGGTQY